MSWAGTFITYFFRHVFGADRDGCWADENSSEDAVYCDAASGGVAN